MDRLHEAIRRGDLPAVQHALHAGADPNHLVAWGADSPLKEAVGATQDPSVRLALAGLLLQAGADPNLPQPENLGPLAAALALRDAQVTRLLLDHGANPNLILNGPESTFDRACRDYRHQVLDLEFNPGPLNGRDIPQEEILTLLDRKAAEEGKERPEHLLLLRDRGARTLEEIQMDHALEAIHEALAALQTENEILVKTPSDALLVGQVGGEPYAIHVNLGSKGNVHQGDPAIPVQVLEACERIGLPPRRIQVERTDLPDGTCYRFLGGRELVEELRRDRRRWLGHMLGGLTMAAWADRFGRVCDLMVERKGVDLVLRVDGAPFALPIADGRVLEGPPVDPVELCRSAVTLDACWIFTCECGNPGCNGIQSGIQVAHHDGFTLWRDPAHPERPLAMFRHWQYRRTILAAVRDLLKHGLKPPCPNLGAADLRPRLNRAYQRARRGRPWFEGPELQDMDILH